MTLGEALADVIAEARRIAGLQAFRQRLQEVLLAHGPPLPAHRHDRATGLLGQRAGHAVEEVLVILAGGPAHDRQVMTATAEERRHGGPLRRPVAVEGRRIRLRRCRHGGRGGQDASGIEQRLALRRPLDRRNRLARDARVQLAQPCTRIGFVLGPRRDVQVLERHRQAFPEAVHRRTEYRQALLHAAVVGEGQHQFVLAPGAVEPRVRDEEDQPRRAFHRVLDLLGKLLTDLDLRRVAPHLQPGRGETLLEQRGELGLERRAGVADENHQEKIGCRLTTCQKPRVQFPCGNTRTLGFTAATLVRPASSTTVSSTII